MDIVWLIDQEPFETSLYLNDIHGFFKEDELISECMSPSTAGVNSFKLHDRAMHVYSEASRVFKFKSVCEEKPTNAIQVSTFLWMLVKALSSPCNERVKDEYCIYSIGVY